ncbi:amine sulfotransferase-like isoform X1 [Haemaphysalis longicornis]
MCTNPREVTMYDESCRYIEGVWLNKFFKEENVRSAINYKPRDGDVFLVTYPKCGTTWMQHIISNVLTRGMPPTDIGEFSIMAPYIDMTGAKAAEIPSRTGTITTHLPPSVFKPVERAKYVYVTRNPYDCAVSYYHFALGMTPKSATDVSFESFLDIFISGKVIHGHYFDHLLPRYERRRDSNVLFLTYEEIKADTAAQVLRVADFLGEEHGKSLLEDRELLERILDACSRESMRIFFKESLQERLEKMLQRASKLSGDSKEPVESPLRVAGETHEGSGFVRKGIVGDWKNYFTPDHTTRTKKWIAENTRGSDVMNLWGRIDLP